ncbi:MAG: MerR family transcriptional regulator [Rhodospirillaceae bacterium]|jgi:DNA-binding transcriptional MerR regulator|nr:MerR family transcriptional regulator [Rhodospirillaceae bacterium]MBT3628057.1 MerR family transcriptional regulator [Rhodospirillaceae bacterium]MBT3925804.1 MerR family transcriptional regulator [Rhodospirillaceae bacterium]MBT4426672.1 MerR family transcriptional regulator [Rhodospirillaceae bacterium]MBT5675731.1 MerR family transcriptional regulator [Rhodospirillaceae bacterium]
MTNVQSTDTASGRVSKSPDAFRTIREVSEELDVPQHVLRFWETKFNQVRPLKRGGGRRYYRPEDVDLLRRIRSLLYADGYTIRGVQKLMRETGGKVPGVAAESEPAKEATAARAGERSDGRTREILSELETLRDMLRGRIPNQ